jgi:NADH:ubiquinone oxidoreductase subunit 4 (subunit M)
VIAVALVVSAAAHLRLGRVLLLGRMAASWRESAELSSYGGRLPDATPLERVALLPLVALLIALGVWPAPLLSTIAGGARDAGAAVDPDGPDALPR